MLRVPMHDGVFVDCGLFGLALRSDFPGLQLAPGVYLAAGWEAWARFCHNTTPGERGLARAALAALDAPAGVGGFEGVVGRSLEP